SIRIGLIVLDDELDGVGLAADLQSVFDHPPDSFDHPGRGLAEIGADTRLRPDEADLERPRLGSRHVHAKSARGGQPYQATGLEEGRPADGAECITSRPRGVDGIAVLVFSPGDLAASARGEDATTSDRVKEDVPMRRGRSVQPLLAALLTLLAVTSASPQSVIKLPIV